MQQGWICLHRKIKNCWVAEDKPYNYMAAWVDMLLRASHEGKKFLLGKEVVSINQGEFVTSISALAEDWGWSRTKVKHFLELLENDAKIVQKKDSKKSVIFIVNWGLYQDFETEKVQKKDSKKTEERQKKDTINNVNNVNNCIKEKYTKEKHRFGEYQNVLLTDEELEKLKQKRPDNWEECIEILSEGLARKGYQYKSHYLAILKWTEKEVRKGESANDRKQRDDIRKADDGLPFS